MPASTTKVKDFVPLAAQFDLGNCQATLPQYISGFAGTSRRYSARHNRVVYIQRLVFKNSHNYSLDIGIPAGHAGYFFYSRYARNYLFKAINPKRSHPPR